MKHTQTAPSTLDYVRLGTNTPLDRLWMPTTAHEGSRATDSHLRTLQIPMNTCGTPGPPLHACNPPTNPREHLNGRWRNTSTPPRVLGGPFLGFMLGSIILGVALLQTYQYFLHYVQDSRWRKTLIAVIWGMNQSAVVVFHATLEKKQSDQGCDSSSQNGRSYRPNPMIRDNLPQAATWLSTSTMLHVECSLVSSHTGKATYELLHGDGNVETFEMDAGFADLCY
ncbi:hypothetical protein BDZ97DRAFT_2074993 [Flammula alnicola]|nr:hypothetical protein BDZ97DRAFT_2074993 [Flammula alnicola]